MFSWINSHIGKKISEYRKLDGCTQEDLGKALNLSRASIANFEAGTQAISIIDLYKVAIKLEKDVKVFLPKIDEVQNLIKEPEQKIQEDKSLTEEKRVKWTSIIKKVKQKQD